MLKALKAKYYSDKVLLGEWILAIVTAAFIFVTVSYVDMTSLTVWSTNVWDSIAEGGIYKFYEISAENRYNLRHAYVGGEMLSLLPWSIWNLPIWLIQRLTGKAIAHSAVMLAYSKLFLVGLSAVTLIFTKKITYIITADKNKATWAMFLSASSVFLYLGVFYAGQNDILMITASVIAVHQMLKGKNKSAMVWVIIAVTIKPFFLLPFLAVLFLKEKKILKIIGYAALSCVGLLAEKLMFMGAPMYSESIKNGPSDKMMKEMFSFGIDTAIGKISFLAIALVLIYIYAYTRDFSSPAVPNQKNRLAKYIVYIITVTYMAYILFSPFSFYRIGLLMPFLYIVIVQNTKMSFYNNILETAMSFSFILKLALRNGTGFMQIRSMNTSLVQRFFGYEIKDSYRGDYFSFGDCLKSKESILWNWQPLFSGVAIVCGVLLLVINHPDSKLKTPLNGDKNCRVLLWARTLIFIPFILALCYMFMRVSESVRIY